MRNIPEKYSPRGTEEFFWLQESMVNNGQKNKMHWNDHTKSFQMISNVSTILLSHLCSQDTQQCTREASIIKQEKNIKPIKLQGGLFSGKMSEHFTLILFFSLFQKQTRKTSPPYKNNKAQSHTFQSSSENNLQWKSFLSTDTKWQISIKNAGSEIL